MREAIVAEELTKKYNGFTAVDHVSFKVRKGEVFGFLGPNGAGKTTTVSMLVTLIKPSKGEAYVAGYSVTKEPRRVREHIGVVFQDPAVDRDLTGYENLWLHGVIYGVPRSRLRSAIQEALQMFDLAQWGDVQVRKYSGGMVRRLELARALLHDPEILFLDEPTLGLDPQARRRMWEYIEKIKSMGKTVFMTTHYMEEAEKLCDRIAIIDHGRILAIGSPEELKSMIGGDVVYVKLDAEPDKAARMLQEKLGAKCVAVDGSVMIEGLKAEEALPEVIRACDFLGLKVREVSYRKPTLEDVFIALTGRRLRDEEASIMDHVRMTVVRARMRR